MINNCPHCNKTPKVKVTVSCQNDKCLEYEVEHYVWDWQAMTKSGNGEMWISTEPPIPTYYNA